MAIAWKISTLIQSTAPANKPMKNGSLMQEIHEAKVDTMTPRTTRCPMSKEGRTVERRNVEMAKKLERTAEMKGIKMELTTP